MHILVIPRWYPSDYHPANGIFIQKHAEAARRQGLRVDVLYAEARPELRGWGLRETLREEAGIPTWRAFYASAPTGWGPLDVLLKALLYFWALWRGYRRLRRRGGPYDVLHPTVLTRPALFAWWLWRWRGIPYVIGEHWTGFLPQNAQYRGRLRRALGRMVCRRAALILTASENLARAMQAEGLRGRYRSLANVVDTALFRPPAERPAGPPFRLLSVVTLNERAKNLSGMIGAAAALRRAGLPLRYTIMGIGPDAEAVRGWAAEAEAELGPFIHFTGLRPVAEVAEAMRQHHALLLYSHYENLPCVIPEAFASGLPVLASDVGGVREMLHRPELGQLLPPGQPALLAEALRAMAGAWPGYSPDLLRREAERRYGYEALGKMLAEVYAAAGQKSG